jgi:hypothetical protein
MEMYYLIIQLLGNGVSYPAVIIPEKYNKEQCEQSGLASGKQYVCVKAPIKICHSESIPGLVSGNGYYRTVCD